MTEERRRQEKSRQTYNNRGSEKDEGTETKKHNLIKARKAMNISSLVIVINLQTKKNCKYQYA